MFSIIILTYNSEKYIRRCLTSLQLQTFTDFEAIVVDAGSNDKTKEIFDEFDERFKWLELPNSDMGMARNFGIQNSVGEIIFFLDSDDFYLPEKLQWQFDFFSKNPEMDVLYTSVWHYRTSITSKVGLKKNNNQPIEIKDFLNGYNHNLNGMSIRRKIWDAGFKFGEGDNGRYGEEWRFQLSIALGKVSMIFAPQPLAVVELRPDSHTLWTRQWKMKEMALQEIAKKSKLLDSKKVDNFKVKIIMDNMRLKLIIAYLLDEKKIEAENEIPKINNSRIKFSGVIILKINSFFPINLTKKLIKYYWTRHQNTSFNWIKPEKKLLDYIVTLNSL